MKEQRLFSSSQWIAMLGSLFAAGVCATAFAFATFEQKSDIKEVLSEIHNRLSGIESALRK